TFATAADGALVVTKNGVSDTLRDIERIQFNDGSFKGALGPNGELTGGGPVDIVVLQTAYVPEFRATGTVVGTLLGFDPDSSSFEFSLVDPTGAYKIDGNQLLVDKGFLIDYEQVALNPVNFVTVQAKDADGNTFQKAIQVTIANVNPENVTGDEN